MHTSEKQTGDAESHLPDNASSAMPNAGTSCKEQPQRTISSLDPFEKILLIKNIVKLHSIMRQQKDKTLLLLTQLLLYGSADSRPRKDYALTYSNSSVESSIRELKPKASRPKRIFFFHVPRASGSSLWSLIACKATAKGLAIADHYDATIKDCSKSRKYICNAFEALAKYNGGQPVDPQALHAIYLDNLDLATRRAMVEIEKSISRQIYECNEEGFSFGCAIHIHTPIWLLDDYLSREDQLIYCVREPLQHTYSLMHAIYQIYITKDWFDEHPRTCPETAFWLLPPELIGNSTDLTNVNAISELYSLFLNRYPKVFSHQLRWIASSIAARDTRESIYIMWEMPANEVLSIAASRIAQWGTSKLAFIFMGKDGAHRFIGSDQMVNLDYKDDAGTAYGIGNHVPHLGSTASRPDIKSLSRSIEANDLPLQALEELQYSLDLIERISCSSVHPNH